MVVNKRFDKLFEIESHFKKGLNKKKTNDKKKELNDDMDFSSKQI
jgi:hypothetical protein